MTLSPDDLPHLPRDIAQRLLDDLPQWQVSTAEWVRLRQELASGALSDERAAELRRELCEQFGPGADTWPICERIERPDGSMIFAYPTDPDAGLNRGARPLRAPPDSLTQPTNPGVPNRGSEQPDPAS